MNEPREAALGPSGNLCGPGGSSLSNEQGSAASGAPFVAEVVRRAEEDYTSLHMPGHKQRGHLVTSELAELWGPGLFRSDLSEIGGLDYLHAPVGALRQAQQLAAEFAGADATYFLINGSTVGNQAALLATVRPGRKVLLPRASHRSLYAGLLLADAVPVFVPPLLHPGTGLPLAFDVDSAEELLRVHPEVDALCITSPSYYGFTSDVARCADLAHRHGIPLLVDEAHGAHFGLYPHLPVSALQQGADLVVHSTHKTLGSLYQSSMLHFREGYADRRKVEQVLAMLQSSSPSALLLASLDGARAHAAAHGAERMQITVRLAQAARSVIRELPGLWCFGNELAGQTGIHGVDPTKLLIQVDVPGFTGYSASRWLADHHQVEAELATPGHLLFSFTMADTDHDTGRLLLALEGLAHAAAHSDSLAAPLARVGAWPAAPRRALGLRTATFAPSEPCPLPKTVGRICAENVIPYPPGIPVLTPGEEIDAQTLAFLQDLLTRGATLVGPESPSLETLRVIS